MKKFFGFTTIFNNISYEFQLRTFDSKQEEFWFTVYTENIRDYTNFKLPSGHDIAKSVKKYLNREYVESARTGNSFRFSVGGRLNRIKRNLLVTIIGSYIKFI